MSQLYIPIPKWRILLQDLWIRSEGVHESGAFLLGSRDGARRCLVEWVLYDDFDPRCLDSGIVEIDGGNLGKLWEYCHSKSLEVIADVHTHPGGASQSREDRENPMVAIPGHIALIVPRYARPPVNVAEVGIFSYQGDRTWQRLPGEALSIA